MNTYTQRKRWWRLCFSWNDSIGRKVSCRKLLQYIQDGISHFKWPLPKLMEGRLVLQHRMQDKVGLDVHETNERNTVAMSYTALTKQYSCPTQIKHKNNGLDKSSPFMSIVSKGTFICNYSLQYSVYMHKKGKDLQLVIAQVGFIKGRPSADNVRWLLHLIFTRWGIALSPR